MLRRSAPFDKHTRVVVAEDCVTEISRVGPRRDLHSIALYWQVRFPRRKCINEILPWCSSEYLELEDLRLLPRIQYRLSARERVRVESGAGIGDKTKRSEPFAFSLSLNMCSCNITLRQATWMPHAYAATLTTYPLCSAAPGKIGPSAGQRTIPPYYQRRSNMLNRRSEPKDLGHLHQLGRSVLDFVRTSSISCLAVILH